MRPGISSLNPTAHLVGDGEEFAMPTTGEYRRRKPTSRTRGFIAATTGGAALVLPLVCAGFASAALLPGCHRKGHGTGRRRQGNLRPEGRAHHLFRDRG